jgi:hypothetical protein
MLLEAGVETDAEVRLPFRRLLQPFLLQLALDGGDQRHVARGVGQRLLSRLPLERLEGREVDAVVVVDLGLGQLELLRERGSWRGEGDGGPHRGRGRPPPPPAAGSWHATSSTRR